MYRTGARAQGGAGPNRKRCKVAPVSCLRHVAARLALDAGGEVGQGKDQSRERNSSNKCGTARTHHTGETRSWINSPAPLKPWLRPSPILKRQSRAKALDS